MIEGIRVRMISLEAIIYFDAPIDKPAKRKMVCEIDRKELRVILETAFKEKSNLNIKSVKFNFLGLGSESKVSHNDAWKKLQSYVPKSLFKLPIIEFIKL